MAAVPISEHIAVEILIHEHQDIDPMQDVAAHPYAALKHEPEYRQIDPLAGRHCPYLKVSQPENTISEHQQIVPRYGRHCAYLNFSQA